MWRCDDVRLRRRDHRRGQKGGGADDMCSVPRCNSVTEADGPVAVAGVDQPVFFAAFGGDEHPAMRADEARDALVAVEQRWGLLVRDWILPFLFWKLEGRGAGGGASVLAGRRARRATTVFSADWAEAAAHKAAYKAFNLVCQVRTSR